MIYLWRGVVALIFQNTDIHQNVFQSRPISQGHFFRLDFDNLTKDLNNNSPCCSSQSRISNTIHISIYQSSDTLLTWFPVCGKVHFLLVRLLGTARANNVILRWATCQFGTWQRFPDLSKSSLVSNREIHLLIYLAMHWEGIFFCLIAFGIVTFSAIAILNGGSTL